MSIAQPSDSEPSRVVLLVFGPPGAGKGTQCKRLAHALQVPHISTGDLLRDHVSRDTTVGQSAKGAMSKGALVPDALVFDMLVQRIAEVDCARGFILDGFPRTLEQAELIDHYFSRKPSNHGHRCLTMITVRLVVSHSSLLRRLAGRRICPVCAAVFNLYTQPPRQHGRCDFDGSSLVTRNDDQDEAVVERLRLYEQQTFPIIRHYAHHATLIEIDGDRPVDTVSADAVLAIRNAVEQAQRPPELPSGAEHRREPQ